jgi:hypothetical protein
VFAVGPDLFIMGTSWFDRFHTEPDGLLWNRPIVQFKALFCAGRVEPTELAGFSSGFSFSQY